MRNILLAVLSGILLMFSFPTILFDWHVPNLGVLGWVALVPLFFAIAHASSRRTYMFALLTGLVCFGGSLYWIYIAVHVYGGVGVVVSILITLLLVVILASYVALAPFLARFISGRWRAEMIVFAPVAWVAVEYARSHVPFGGFPWANIAMSQWAFLVPMQIADVVGVYGLIFVMVWVNWYIAELILALRGDKRTWLVPKLVVTIILVVSIFGYGLYRLETLNENLEVGDTVSAGIVQGNIPQDEKWSSRLGGRHLEIHRALTRKLFESGVDLIVWPEASFTPRVTDETVSADPRVFGLPPEVLGDLPSVLIGAVVNGPGDIAYNSALLFNAKGTLLGRYDKMHLVPFGEYIPLRDVFFFARKITAPIGDFMPGADYEILEFGDNRIGLLLCFEDAFPDISRGFALRGANLLVNITNDAWYHVSSAPYQHLALSVFRAVENRRYLLRSANTGVSALIAPSGEVLMQSPIFEKLIMAGAVWPVKTMSLYTRYGDWFAWGCIVYTAFGLLMAVIAAIRKRS